MLVSEHSSPAHALRQDVSAAMCKSQLDPAGLSAFQRVILTADGTLTPLLEAYLSEKLQVVKLSERIAAFPHVIPLLDTPSGQHMIERKIWQWVTFN